MPKRYAVQMIIAETDGTLEPAKQVGEPLELAAFDTQEEAEIFRAELSRYVPYATGEAVFREEIDRPEEYTPGD